MLEKDEKMFREVLGLPTETLKAISEDTIHNKFLTDSNIMALNFDKAAEQYCINNAISKYPASNDALYLFNLKKFIHIHVMCKKRMVLISMVNFMKDLLKFSRKKKENIYKIIKILLFSCTKKCCKIRFMFLKV